MIRFRRLQTRRSAGLVFTEVGTKANRLRLFCRSRNAGIAGAVNPIDDARDHGEFLCLSIETCARGEALCPSDSGAAAPRIRRARQRLARSAAIALGDKIVERAVDIVE